MMCFSWKGKVVLISSSVWSTADTTAEESGLLPLATIRRNLKEVELLVAKTELYVLKNSSRLIVFFTA